MNYSLPPKRQNTIYERFQTKSCLQVDDNRTVLAFAKRDDAIHLDTANAPGKNSDLLAYRHDANRAQESYTYLLTQRWWIDD